MKLAKREKLFVSAAGGILGIFLILELIVFPFFDKKDQLEKDTETIEKSIGDLDRIGTAGQDISEISGGLERALSTRKETLYAFVNGGATAIGLKKNNIARLDTKDGKEQGGYVEDILEVQLNAITTPQLTKFLYRIEKPEKYIFINSIRIRKNKKDEGYVDATVRVMSYKKANSEQ